MRSFYQRLLILLLVMAGGAAIWAGEYRLTNNDVVRGEPVSFNEEGFVVRLEVGGFSPRISWSQVSQETLRELQQIPQAKQFVDPWIIVPPEEKRKEREQQRQIVLRDVPRVELPEETSLGAAMVSGPIGIAMLVILYILNLFAAYQIAVFRDRPIGLVCGVSAILPVIGPIIFLAMPGGAAGETAAPPAPAEATAAAPVAAAAAASTGGLGLAAMDKPAHANASQAAQVYRRGDVTFNRRFFETKFPGFFRIVPSEAEKDLVLVFKTAKQEIIGKRISRIASNELHVQTLRGGSEVMVPFGELAEVQVRHKDAKA